MSTSTADHKTIIRRMNDEVWGDGDLDLIDEFVSPDYVEHNTAAPGAIHGTEGYQANVEQFHAAFSDVEVTTEHLFAEGDRVVNHYTITAIHDGPFMDIEPTGSEVTVSGIAIARFEGGRLVEDWSQVDVMGLMQQLGVVELG